MPTRTTSRTKVADQVWVVAAQAVMLVPFDREAARRYALIRQDRAIRAPDALQLACAATARTDLFVTNDERLSRCTVPGIQFITSLDHAFL